MSSNARTSLESLPDINEYVKDHPEIKSSYLYQAGQSYKGSNAFLGSPTLQNQWYVVASSAQLPADGNQKLFIQLFGEPIILYRSLPDGKVVAAQDRCPHRSAPLSMGVASNGELRCRYHDWKFGEQGKATDIPAAGKGFVDKVQLFTIPCRELNGLVYVYHGDCEANAVPEFNEDYNAVHTAMPDCYEETIGDLDGIFVHHLENLIDFAHTYFIHKNRLPFRSSVYSKEAPFDCKQFRDKRGFIMVIEKKTGQKTVFRFDPPCTWMAGPLDTQICNVAYMVPVNKNHTRIIFRGYMKLFRSLRYIPFFNDMQLIESWRILDEDNSLIAGQSVRTDYCGAPIAFRSRSEDGNIALIYKYFGTAINNDIGKGAEDEKEFEVSADLKKKKKKKKSGIWFTSWNCNNTGAICSNTGTEKVFNMQDIEDILSEPMVITAPWGKQSASAMMKQYPPANRTMMQQTENKLAAVKWTAVVSAAGFATLAGYLVYKRKK